MKITLIYPGIATTGFNSLGKSFHDAIAIGYGLAYLGSYVKKHSKHNVDLIDLRKMQGWDHFQNELQKINPDVVGIYFNTVNYEYAIKCASIAKGMGKITIAGGPHATINPDEILNTKMVDHVVLGEGEKTIVKILNDLEKGIESEKKIEGEKVENLDDIPFPDRDLYDMKSILNSSGIFPYPHRYAGILTSRGCPFNCSFCQPIERKIFGNKVRYRSVENVISEVEHVIKKYNINFIMFEDDTFTYRKEWLLKLCSEIKKFNIKWGAQSRVDTWDKEIAKAMSAAGCIVVFFGFESGSPDILRFLRKGTTVEQAIRSADMCKENNILIFANYMLGIPTEKKEDLEKTYELMRKVLPDIHSPTFFSPTPGSDLYEYCSESDLIKVKDYKEFVRNPIYEKIKGVDYPVLKRYFNKILKLSPKWFTRKHFRNYVLERWCGLIRDGKSLVVIKEFFLYTPFFNFIYWILSVLKAPWRKKVENY